MMMEGMGMSRASCGFIVGRVVCVSQSRLGNSQTFGAVSPGEKPEEESMSVLMAMYETRIGNSYSA